MRDTAVWTILREVAPLEHMSKELLLPSKNTGSEPRAYPLMSLIELVVLVSPQTLCFCSCEMGEVVNKLRLSETQMGREIKIDLNPGLTIKSVFLIMKPFTLNVFFQF